LIGSRSIALLHEKVMKKCHSTKVRSGKLPRYAYQDFALAAEMVRLDLGQASDAKFPIDQVQNRRHERTPSFDQ
jgi:hypothetical protein